MLRTIRNRNNITKASTFSLHQLRTNCASQKKRYIPSKSHDSPYCSACEDVCGNVCCERLGVRGRSGVTPSLVLSDRPNSCPLLPFRLAHLGRCAFVFGAITSLFAKSSVDMHLQYQSFVKHVFTSLCPSRYAHNLLFSVVFFI